MLRLMENLTLGRIAAGAEDHAGASGQAGGEGAVGEEAGGDQELEHCLPLDSAL